MRSIEKSGRTVEEAIQEALRELGIDREDAEIVVLEEGSKGFFGLLRGRLARVRVGPKAVPSKQADAAGDGRTSRSAADRIREQEAKEAAMARAQSFLAGVLDRLGIVAGIEMREDDGIVHMNVTGAELGLLIGRRGQTLDAVQYLVNIVANREAGKSGGVRVVLDAEGYRERRAEYLRALARRVGERVRQRGGKAVLDPMTALERRVIHLALKDDPDLTTFSEGKEPNRRVVIMRKRDGT